MPPKGKERTRPVNEQILVEAARIYDNRELRDEEDDVRMMKGTDLMSFSKFLSKQDAFTKVRQSTPERVAHATYLGLLRFLCSVRAKLPPGGWSSRVRPHGWRSRNVVAVCAERLLCAATAAGPA